MSTPEPNNPIFMDSVSSLYTPTTPVKSYPMEIDSTPRKIEAMDIDPPVPTSLTKVPSNVDVLLNEDFLQMTVAKILRFSLKPEAGRVHLAAVCPEHPLNNSTALGESHQVWYLSHYLVGDFIMEGIDLIVSGNTSCGLLFEEGDNSKNCLQYLIDSYCRAERFEKKYSKRCSAPPVRELLSVIRTELCSTLALLLEGIVPTAEPTVTYYDILYQQLKNHILPSGFFYEFVQHLQSDTVRFQKIFSPLLYAIRTESQRGSIADSSHQGALQVLAELCEYRSSPNSSNRPFCTLITRMSNWLVEPVTEAAGREFAKFTFLGPFLCASLFAEDDTRIADKLKSSSTSAEASRPIVSSLQQEMDLTRQLLHKAYVLLALSMSIKQQ